MDFSAVRRDNRLTTLLKQMTDSIIQNMTEGFLAVSFEGTIVYGNTAAFCIIGLPEEEIIGKSIYSLFSRDPRNNALLRYASDVLRKKKESIVTLAPY